MRNATINVLEMIIGAILIGLGLLYLTSQYKAVDKLTRLVSDAVLDESEIYRQYSYINIDQISAKELYAIIMGYREYPIMIDGINITTDETENNSHMALVKNGYYTKSYEYDSDNNIVKIIYTYSGT